jgi:AcrR family transcriptional regulator
VSASLPRSDGTCDVDPRVERSRRVILEATLDELGEVGYGAFTVEGVARRAGVGKATVYRHWPGKLSLVADAIEHLRQPPAVGHDGPLRDRIVQLLRSLAVMVSDSRWAQCMPAIIDAAGRDDAVREFHHRFSAECRSVLVDLLDTGRRTGELPAELDPDLACEVLAGPIFYRKLMTPEPFPPELVDAVVDRVLPELRPGPVTRSPRGGRGAASASSAASAASTSRAGTRPRTRTPGPTAPLVP